MSESIKIKYIAPLRGTRGQSEDGLSYLGLENIESGTGKIIESETPIVSDGVTSYYQKDDVLFGKLRPYLAKVVLAKNEGVCTGELLVLNSKKEKVSPAFLAYRLRADDFIKAVDNSTYGSKMPRANWTFIGDQKIDLPSLVDQLKVAKKLDTDSESIARLIEQKRLLIGILKEQRVAIIHHAVTRGLDKSVEYIESGVEWIGKVPADWKIKKLKHLGHFYSGGTPETANLNYWNGSIPWVSPKDMKSEVIRTTEDTITELGLANTAGMLIPPRSWLLVYRSGILRHSLPTAVNEVSVAVNQDIKVLITNDAVDPEYLRYFVDGNVTNLLNKWRKLGATVESLDHASVANTEIPLPSLCEQKRIITELNQTLKKIDAATDRIIRSCKLLIEYRESLIVKSVSGT